MPIFRERVLPSASNLVLPLMLFPSVYAIMLPLAPEFALAAAFVLTILFVGFIILSSPVVLVTSKELKAKNAVISRDKIGEVSVIEPTRKFETLGVELDSRAWLCIQSSVKGLVRLEINDPEDSTPYWLISTRKPEELAKLLRN